MGVMNEPALLEVPSGLESITPKEFDAYCREHYHCKTEVEVKPGLSLIKLYAALYENGKPTNGIININQPWDVRVWFGLTGPLHELICGKWCVIVHLESFGPGGEFRLQHPEFHFDCHSHYFYVRIPGRDVHPTDCTTPYKMVVTVAYKTECGKPGPIVGFCELPLVQFYDAKYDAE